jgi:predicted RNase H-like nuclease (RuvC/YqgF family)
MSKSSNITKHQFDMASNGIVGDVRLDRDRERRTVQELEKKVRDQARQIETMTRGYDNLKQAYLERTGETWNSREYAIKKGWIK